MWVFTLQYDITCTLQKLFELSDNCVDLLEVIVWSIYDLLLIMYNMFFFNRYSVGHANL